MQKFLAAALAGDESGLTHNGNNNWYGHDQPWTHMQWELSAPAEGLQRFTRELLQLRRQHPALGRETFMGCVHMGEGLGGTGQCSSLATRWNCALNEPVF